LVSSLANSVAMAELSVVEEDEVDDDVLDDVPSTALST
jgi:hypothetical protein